MTDQPNNNPTDVGNAAASREDVYFVANTAQGRSGNCYLPLTVRIESRDDVEWVRDELRRQGLINAVVLSFALLPGGWSR